MVLMIVPLISSDKTRISLFSFAIEGIEMMLMMLIVLRRGCSGIASLARTSTRRRVIKLLLNLIIFVMWPLSLSVSVRLRAFSAIRLGGGSWNGPASTTSLCVQSTSSNCITRRIWLSLDCSLNVRFHLNYL